MVPLEYLAGFVDGEGYLGLAKVRRRNRTHEYCLRVSIYNSNLAILKEIQRTIGGTMSAVGQQKPAWKPSYALIWTNAAAAGVIRRIGPFLCVKSQQSAALLAFDDHIRAGHRHRNRAGHLLALSAREVEFREGFYRRMKRLNRKGPFGRGKREGHRRSIHQSKVSPKYVAGLIDAEGALMITKTRVADCRSPSYRPRISLSNTNKHVLETIQGEYGGIIANQPAPKAAWRHAYQLVWTEGTIEALLLSVQAHLRVKRRQARILNDFIRQRKTTARGRNGFLFAPLPYKVLAFREGLRRQIKVLNKRGVLE